MTIDDLPAVFRIGNAVFTKDRYVFLYRTWEDYEVTGLFYSDRDLCIVAEQGDIVLGFAMASVISKPKSPWTYGYLVWTAVNPEFQQESVGRKMYLEIERRVRHYGARMMIIDTEGTNIGAVTFFNKMGFATEGQHLWMTKLLKPYRRVKLRS